MWDGKNSIIVVHLNIPKTILVQSFLQILYHLAIMTLCLTMSHIVYMLTTTLTQPKMTFLSRRPHHPWWPSYQPCHIAGEANGSYVQSMGIAASLPYLLSYMHTAFFGIWCCHSHISAYSFEVIFTQVFNCHGKILTYVLWYSWSRNKERCTLDQSSYNERDYYEATHRIWRDTYIVL